MKCGARVALGVVGGYFLGRTKKMKLALMLGSMAAGRSAGGPGELLSQGSKLLQSNPEIAALTDQVRSRLLDAGKNAVLSVATRQVASLTDRVGKRVETLGNAGGAARSAAGKAGSVIDQDDGADDDAQDTAEPEDTKDSAEDTADDPADDSADDSAEDSADDSADGGESRPAPRRRRSTSSTSDNARQTTSRARSTAKKAGTAAAGRTASKATSKTPTRAKATASSNGSTRRRSARRSDDARLPETHRRRPHRRAEGRRPEAAGSDGAARGRGRHRPGRRADRPPEGVAENGGTGLRDALRSRSDDDDRDDDDRDDEEGDGDENSGGGIFSKLKDTVTGFFGGGGGGGGGGKKLKFTNIVETIDVGVPLRLAYDQWTQFDDFPTFMKKVESVDADHRTRSDLEGAGLPGPTAPGRRRSSSRCPTSTSSGAPRARRATSTAR